MSLPSISDTLKPPAPVHPSSEDEQKKADLKAKLAIIYNKYKDRLTTLPKERGGLTDTLYLYQGFWYDSMGTMSVTTIMASQDTFKAQPTDIYLPSLPKSGTTWLKALAFAIVKRDKYKNESISTHPLKIHNPHKCVSYIEVEFLNDTYVDEHSSPRIFGTHMPYTSLPRSVTESNCRLVYVCRNPKDVLVSMFHYANKLRGNSLGVMTLEEAFEMFSKGVIPSGPYWDHVKGYYMAALDHPGNILFLKYEDMQMDTVNEVKRLAEFLGYPFCLDEEEQGVVQQIINLCKFENLKEVDKNGKVRGVVPNNSFFREGKVGDWTNHLTDEMSQVLDKITKEKFHGLDISF